MSIDGEFLDHTFECGCHSSTALDEAGHNIFLHIACPKQRECPNTIMVMGLAKAGGTPVPFHENPIETH